MELYIALVLSETLESRERRSRARSAPARRVSGAGGGALAPSWWTGRRGFCASIFWFLNVSYNSHYRSC